MGLSNAPGRGRVTLSAVPAACSIAMRNRLFPCLFVLASALRRRPSSCPAEERRPKAPPVIPPPRAEPVVPPSPAKSIATQLNDAYVSVFERVAPGVVVIDVIKKPSAEADGDGVFPDFFFPPGTAGEGFRRGQPPTIRRRRARDRAS